VDKPKFLHAEAFHLMTYRCEECGFVEQIWNSRDGVTPFSIACHNCAKLAATHINWQHDRFLPDHVPASGERLFVDMPESLKLVFAHRRIIQVRGTEFEIVDKAKEAEVIEAIVKSFQPGTPFLVVMP
jgi:hypothetical protein